MAAQVAIEWGGPAEANEVPEVEVAWRPGEEEQTLSPGRLLAAATVAVTACLLIVAPGVVGLAWMADGHAVVGAPAWMQGIPGVLSKMAAWRVPAAIALVLGLAVIRRIR